MQKSTENVAKSPKFCTLTGNRGRRIERSTNVAENGRKYGCMLNF